jgi:putative hydrolases of HD superfamily
MNTKKLVNYIFEINHLKKIKHNGWYLAGVDRPDSVAEHVMRAAQIGYLLAVMEGDADPERVASMVLFHDNPESRIGDNNKVTARYQDSKPAEVDAFKDQVKDFDKKMKENLESYFMEFERRNSKEGVIAKDADWLEMAFQAKEYADLGYSSAIDWINNVEKAVETKSAKLIIKEMKRTKFYEWWQGLKKMTYKKISK